MTETPEEGDVTRSLTCHSCGTVLSADTGDQLVDLDQAYAVEHGQHSPPPREHTLARIRRHNPT